jgi:hypothetical protein
MSDDNLFSLSFHKKGVDIWGKNKVWFLISTVSFFVALATLAVLPLFFGLIFFL